MACHWEVIGCRTVRPTCSKSAAAPQSVIIAGCDYVSSHRPEWMINVVCVVSVEITRRVVVLCLLFGSDEFKFFFPFCLYFCFGTKIQTRWGGNIIITPVLRLTTELTRSLRWAVAPPARHSFYFTSFMGTCIWAIHQQFDRPAAARRMKNDALPTWKWLHDNLGVGGGDCPLNTTKTRTLWSITTGCLNEMLGTSWSLFKCPNSRAF